MSINDWIAAESSIIASFTALYIVVKSLSYYESKSDTNKLISFNILVSNVVIISVLAVESISLRVSVISWRTFVSTLVAQVVMSAITVEFTSNWTSSISVIKYVSSAVIVGLTNVYILGIWVAVLVLIVVVIPVNSVSIAVKPLVFIVIIKPDGPVESYY